MITAAGPSIGVPTNSPLLRDADDLKTGHVSLGDVEILGTSEAPAKKPDAGK